MSQLKLSLFENVCQNNTFLIFVCYQFFSFSKLKVDLMGLSIFIKFNKSCVREFPPEIAKSHEIFRRRWCKIKMKTVSP